MKQQAAFVAGLMAYALGAQAADTWTLEQSLDYALAHNPDARIAEQRIAAAQAGLEQANSAFWPRLQAESSYSRTNNPILAFGSIINQQSYSPSFDFNDISTVDNFNLKGVITVPIYSGGRNTADQQFAQANTAAAKQDGAAVRNELGFEVTRAFHTVLKTRRFIAAAQAAVNALEFNLEVGKKRLAGGTLLKSEVLDIEVRLAQAREERVHARNANALAKRALSTLLGVEDAEFEVADQAPVVSVPDAGDFARRPEIAAARERESAAQAQVRSAKSGYQPRVSAFGSLDYNAGWVTGGDGQSYTAGILAQWDLWDGYSTRAKVRAANAKLEVAREQQRKLRLALEFEIQQAQLNLQAANERLAVTSKTVEQAAESSSLTRSRFEQGLALSIQLIDSEAALLAARVRRAQAESDQYIAVAALRKALALPQLDNPLPAK